ncbi:MAG: AAA family ATPase [Candidatus Omnitrophica bacterium]|nr:AAA family ATPase [Candidatus Omnitrophota bacterium]
MLITFTGVAGSGKTTQSLKYALKLAKEEDIRIITLTNLGTSMVRERNDKLDVSTVHSFAFNIVREANNNVNIFDESDKEMYFHTTLRLNFIPNVRGFETYKLPEGNKIDLIKRKILNTFFRDVGELKINSVLNVIDSIKNDFGIELDSFQIYKKIIEYENYLRNNNFVDFDYMLLDAYKNVSYSKFNYEILVWDEANDSMPIIVELINKIASEKKFEYVIINGDPAQTIYDNLLFSKPELFFNLFNKSDEKHILNKSKRLGKNIVDEIMKIYKKIPKNDRIAENIETDKDGGNVFKINYEKMLYILRNGRELYNKDTAIITLSNSKAFEIGKILSKNCIPFSVIYEGKKFGWDYYSLAVRNFLYFCINKKFDENFIDYYLMVKEFLSPKLDIGNLEVYNEDIIRGKFGVFENVVENIDFSKLNITKETILRSLYLNFHIKKPIKIITTHSAKGLEYENVFAILEPTRHFIDEFVNNDIINYYRRLVYVQMSRVLTNLFIVGDLNLLL